MNKLQQAAKEYSEQNCLGDSIIKTTVNDAFLAGAACADGAFAEWICNNMYTAYSGKWYSMDRDEGLTTAELYQIWQQSL